MEFKLVSYPLQGVLKNKSTKIFGHKLFEAFHCICVKCIMVCNCMCSSSSSSSSPFSSFRFSDSHALDFGIVNLHFGFWKSHNMVDRGGDFSLFQSVHAKTDIRIGSFIRSMTNIFGKQARLRELTQMRLIKQVLVMSSRHDHYISTNIVPMATKLGSMVTNLQCYYP